MRLPDTVDLAPGLLLKLREAYHVSLDEISDDTGFEIAALKEFEGTGRAVPGKLINHYHREFKKPVAFFLLPTAAEIKLNPGKLRTHKNLPEEEFEKTTLFEVARITQRIELLESLGYISQRELALDTATFDANPKIYAERIRKLLNIDSKPSAAKNWLQHWIDRLESAGLLVAQVPLQEGLSGFLLKTPAGLTSLVLDSGEPTTRRLFTLGHELGHFLIGRKGHSYSYASEETFCNKFAGALLLPRELLSNPHINLYLENNLEDTHLIAAAKTLGLSPEMVLRRIVDEKISEVANQRFYEEWKASYESAGGDYKNKTKGGGSLTYYYTTYNKVGRAASRMLLKARSAGLIDTPTFVTHTGVQSANIKKFASVVAP